MKVVYYYRGRTGSAGFLLPEDMALLKRLFAHGSLPPKAQLRGKRCWLYLRVNTKKTACRSSAYTKIICADGTSGGPASGSWRGRLPKRKWITSCPVNRIGSTGATTCGASCSMRITCTPSVWTSCIPSNRTKQTGIHPISLWGVPMRCAPVFQLEVNAAE